MDRLPPKLDGWLFVSAKMDRCMVCDSEGGPLVISPRPAAWSSESSDVGALINPGDRPLPAWNAWPMRLIGGDGQGVELGIVDYQFPDAADPRQRRSWLVVEGTAHCPRGTWSFRWPALTADDAVELARWLGQAAARASGAEPCSGRLDFTEPNLVFAFTKSDPAPIELLVSLDLEFLPPWRRQARSGEPFVVACLLTAEALSTAAAEWATEIKPFPPDGNRERSRRDARIPGACVWRRVHLRRSGPVRLVFVDAAVVVLAEDLSRVVGQPPGRVTCSFAKLRSPARAAQAAGVRAPLTGFVRPAGEDRGRRSAARALLAVATLVDVLVQARFRTPRVGPRRSVAAAAARAGPCPLGEGRRNGLFPFGFAFGVTSLEPAAAVRADGARAAVRVGECRLAALAAGGRRGHRGPEPPADSASAAS
jgi:hypothetical protein